MTKFNLNSMHPDYSYCMNNLRLSEIDGFVVDIKTLVLNYGKLKYSFAVTKTFQKSQSMAYGLRLTKPVVTHISNQLNKWQHRCFLIHVDSRRLDEGCAPHVFRNTVNDGVSPFSSYVDGFIGILKKTAY